MRDSLRDQSITAAKTDVVLLATADWDNPFWTNKQHVAVTLAACGHRVLYIDSLGLRRPTAGASDLARIRKRVFRALRSPRKVQDNIWVWSPIVLPWHGSSVARFVNRLAFGSLLSLWMRLLGLRRDVLWTYNPLSTEFFDLRTFGRTVYHCVDEIKAQPGMPAATIETLDANLTSAVDVVFATSPLLAENRKKLNGNTHYFPNVADYSHFSKAQIAATDVPADIGAIPNPRLGFIGAVSGYKIDFSLVTHIARERPDWSIVLIGKVGEGDPDTDIGSLSGFPNVHLLGPRPYADLPGYLKGIDVALLPNNINEYTDSMFPMKFFEYLAAGKPIVSVDLKAIREFRDVVAIAHSPAEFVHAVAQVLAGDVPPLESRIGLAKLHTYQARTTSMLALLEPMHIRGATMSDAA